MKDLSAADEQRILSADPAANVTETELARSRSRSLAFMESDVTHIFAGGPETYSRPPARRWRAAGAFLAAAAVAAAVLTANFLPSLVETPAATESVSPPAPAPTSAPEPAPPAGPFHDLFVSADEVLVLEALPNAARSLGAGLGVEPVYVRQVLKGGLAPGGTSVDVASAEAGINGSLLWRDSREEAPFTYLGFFARGADGGLHLMEAPHALLQIQNIRTAATVDPVTDKPVEIGADLQSRIKVAPVGDVPVATHDGGSLAAAAPDRIWGTQAADGSRDGEVRGYVAGSEACFTFANSTEKVYLRWPVGFTAKVTPLMVDAEGHVSYGGTTVANRAVILNEWGFIYMADLDTRPLVQGQLTAETASCGGETLPVFDVWPERAGGSPFQKGRGVALPTP
ncbi:hypothetical protein [Arthrobacter sp. BE255]|uniref:hypothetical protein n=1 Tax=Arthrobacter sp. BE255 TaxID=2817721 RepID=UPI00285817BA|nr:hypothetical protein [Arthrobacter sp. BE255]MDR7161344.1 hypothetical protein [Arthrobacter sp. BE255]